MTDLIAAFLTDLANADRSVHTQRAYATELRRLTAFHAGSITTITPTILRIFFAQHRHLKPASRARMHAALTRFFRWTEQHDLIPTNPMTRIASVRVETPLPRPRPRAEVEAVLAVIPASNRRDQLLFRLLLELGLRVREVLTLAVEDLSLERDNERLTVLGKGGKRRTLLLDDPKLVKRMKTYLQQTGFRHGLLFRAVKNGDGGPLRYQSIQERWAAYCATAGVHCTLHQLRHTHASELVTDGVSLATVRKRLGHANIQTTLRYAEQADATSDAEIRQWRRKKS
ncbi:tyrosine-type recombinase/integrase [Herpetosiphon giganteus]|uniref:tyrosine-type recombinase/integrase n=1 Tax=Herpetosiphon giganteus TaxID=2029754 RepID=UPI0019590725|nr:tyrosine-type recombinase/integrase [Herpetosiphon giganteus]MBM7846548.1 site-specific recombinase XerD [Herpetosiphon giganteus]